MLAESFADYEQELREHLGGMLRGTRFDFDRDVSSITVNRWAHGYTYMYDFIEEPYYPDWNDERYLHVRARKPFGRITIANADSAASATIDAAVAQAHRAVSELS